MGEKERRNSVSNMTYSVAIMGVGELPRSKVTCAKEQYISRAANLKIYDTLSLDDSQH